MHLRHTGRCSGDRRHLLTRAGGDVILATRPEIAAAPARSAARPAHRAGGPSRRRGCVACRGGIGHFDLAFSPGRYGRPADAALGARASPNRTSAGRTHALLRADARQPAVAAGSRISPQRRLPPPPAGAAWNEVAFLNGLRRRKLTAATGGQLHARALRLQTRASAPSCTILTGNLKVAADGLEALAREARVRRGAVPQVHALRPRDSPGRGRPGAVWPSSDELTGVELALAPDLVVRGRNASRRRRLPSSSAASSGSSPTPPAFPRATIVHRLARAHQPARGAGRGEPAPRHRAGRRRGGRPMPSWRRWRCGPPRTRLRQRAQIEPGRCIRCLTCLPGLPLPRGLLLARPARGAAGRLRALRDLRAPSARGRPSASPGWSRQTIHALLGSDTLRDRAGRRAPCIVASPAARSGRPGRARRGGRRDGPWAAHGERSSRCRAPAASRPEFILSAFERWEPTGSWCSPATTEQLPLPPRATAWRARGPTTPRPFLARLRLAGASSAVFRTTGRQHGHGDRPAICPSCSAPDRIAAPATRRPTCKRNSHDNANRP
ncbi:MAG: hypothetical protein MZV70_64395 [Desulfobacterales bacterium]|nr:hypothetical protein [Desulfobacterales bacterium]